jgi:phenylpyruvate tautomerase PptA (4-oxalocrotonate tautomerase family)
MPYWEIFAPEGAFTPEDKKGLSSDLAHMYAENVDIPLFYTVVRFQDLPANSLYVGGEDTTNFVRIVVDHIARHLPDPEYRKFAMGVFEATIAPYVRDKGLDWEIHFDETPLDLWRVQGLIPPPAGTELEKLWAEENRAIPYDEGSLLPL